MRRKDKEIIDWAELARIIMDSPYVVVGIKTAGEPYLVPLNFGFDGKNIYVHGAKEGRKLDLICANPEVSLLFVDYQGVYASEKDNTACSYSTSFASVMASGKARILENQDDKLKALSVFMSKIGKQDLPIRSGMLDVTSVIEIEILEMSGKVNPAAPRKTA